MTQKFIKLNTLYLGAYTSVGIICIYVNPDISKNLYPQSSANNKVDRDLDDDNFFYIASSDFIKAVLEHKNGESIFQKYIDIFGDTLYSMLILIPKEECEEIIL